LTAITLHVRTESYGNLRTPRPPVKTARLNLSYGNFSGRIMLEIDSKLKTKNKNSVYKQGFMNFMLITTVQSDSELPRMSSRRAYPTC
jgi:hypothetical protein